MKSLNRLEGRQSVFVTPEAGSVQFSRSVVSMEDNAVKSRKSNPFGEFPHITFPTPDKLLSKGTVWVGFCPCHP